MKCPILKVSTDRHGGMEIVRANNCLQEECAWWDKPPARCGFLTAAMELGSISYFLKTIRDYMPHAGQFTK